MVGVDRQNGLSSDLPRVSKNSFVTANTIGDSTTSATRFGIAIIAFRVSARSQIKPSFTVAPIIAASDQTARNGMIMPVPNRY